MPKESLPKQFQKAEQSETPSFEVLSHRRRQKESAIKLSPEQDQKLLSLLDQAKKLENEGQSEAALKLYQEYQQEFQSIQLEQKKDQALKSWSFESLSLEKLEEQYNDKKEALTQTGVLEKLSTGELGIKGIDNQEYPFPTLQDIQKEIINNKEVLEHKMSQGFTELEIVPFASPLSKLIQAAEQTILQQHKDKKLFATKKDPEDPKEKLVPLELDEKQPLWVWKDDKNSYFPKGEKPADESGKLVYYPQEFSKDNHQGQTKQEVLDKQTSLKGYNVIFREKNLNIPAENQGEIINDRPQLEANKTPNEYLKTLQTPSTSSGLEQEPYQNETGLTPEDWLSIFIAHLQKTNQVIDDWQGHGKVSYLTGSYLTASGNVPDAYWNRGYRRAVLDRYYPADRDGYFGVRSAVRL